MLRGDLGHTQVEVVANGQEAQASQKLRNLNARLDVWRCRRLMHRPHPRLDPAVSGMTWLRYPVPRRAPPDLRAGMACLTPAQAEPGNGYPCEVLNYTIDPLAGPPKEAVQGKSLLGGLGRLSLPVYHYPTMSPTPCNLQLLVL